MHKIKYIFLFIILAFFASKTNIALATGSSNTGASSISASWLSPQKIAVWMIKATLTGIIAVLLSPDLLKFFARLINKKYADDLKLQSLTSMNEHIRIQLEYLRQHCNDKKLIKAMEETYLKSCIQIMELQKKHLETYGPANMPEYNTGN